MLAFMRLRKSVRRQITVARIRMNPTGGRAPLRRRDFIFRMSPLYRAKTEAAMMLRAVIKEVQARMNRAEGVELRARIYSTHRHRNSTTDAARILLIRILDYRSSSFMDTREGINSASVTLVYRASSLP